MSDVSGQPAEADDAERAEHDGQLPEASTATHAGEG
jgi:hypothetical protein